MKHSTHSFLVYIESLLGIFAALEMRFFKGHEKLCWREHESRLATFYRFGGLKMRFLPCREIHYSRATGFLATWKFDSWRVMSPWNQRYIAFVALLYGILMAWKYVSSGFQRPSSQGYVATGGCKFYILEVWKCDIWRVVRPSAQVYMATCESLFTFWRQENAIPNGSWDPWPIGILHPQSLWSWFWRPVNDILQGSWDPCLKNTWLPVKILEDWKCYNISVVK
jgi:hypothetical protein